MNTVFAAISAVQKELAEKGIGKHQTNTFDKYQFRGIDDVYNALGPVLAKHGLVIFPKVTKRELIERTSQKGGVMIHAILDIEYTFAGPDGSTIDVPVIGEALDRGDKSINKAFSAAYKLACFQTFCIPVDGQDTEKESHTIDGRKPTRAVDAALDGIRVNQQEASEYVAGIQAAVFNEDGVGLAQLMDELKTDADMKLAVWSKLNSADRSYIKRFEEERRNAA
jgi:hypothetical protein